MNALEIEHLTKTYHAKSGDRVAVNDLSMTVADGEILGLLGTNGAGKSTTIKIATGLASADSGTVRIFGHDIAKESTQAKELLNVSPQETAVAPNLSVKENLVFVAEVYGKKGAEAEKSADEMMKRLKLSDRANDKAGKLSGGYKRRLSIAMALISEPKLLFLDEPTLGLDVIARRELWHFLKSIKGSISMVLTTHYLEEAEALCDRIVIISEGVAKACGTASDLLELAGADNIEDAFLKLSGMEELIDE